MGVGRLFRPIDLCHAKRDFAGLDLLPESIELLKLVRVGAHKGRREVEKCCGAAAHRFRRAFLTRSQAQSD
jgi:hypothetical protein